eukprot:COSAG01_NODE_770_length_13726_cov_66.211639_3_plen_213_part_00
MGWGPRRLNKYPRRPATWYSGSEQDLSLPPIMKFQQQQQQTHSDSSKMNILLILRSVSNATRFLRKKPQRRPLYFKKASSSGCRCMEVGNLLIPRLFHLSAAVRTFLRGRDGGAVLESSAAAIVGELGDLGSALVAVAPPVTVRVPWRLRRGMLPPVGSAGAAFRESCGAQWAALGAVGEEARPRRSWLPAACLLLGSGAACLPAGWLLLLP